MQTPSWIRLTEIIFALLLVAVIVVSWREDRRDRTQLAAQLATAQQALNAADARQHDRDAQLQQSLAAIAAQKRATQTPQQILADLPNQLPLPTPLTQLLTNLPDAPQPNCKPDPASRGTASPCPSGPQPTQVVIPPEDLKPLYDFTLDCKACQSKLTAAQADLFDEKIKSATLAKERDAAVQAAKGGTLLRRIARAAKWFAVGAAAGALAAKTAHH